MKKKFTTDVTLTFSTTMEYEMETEGNNIVPIQAEEGLKKLFERMVNEGNLPLDVKWNGYSFKFDDFDLSFTEVLE